jgi:hypothetical protein
MMGDRASGHMDMVERRADPAGCGHRDRHEVGLGGRTGGLCLSYPQAFFRKHHYWDAKRERRALYTSFTSSPDSLGFSLRAKHGAVEVRRGGKAVIEYDNEILEAALLSKHMQTAFIALRPTRDDGGERCEIESALYCKWPSIIRFLRLVDEGLVFLDLTMSERSDGKIKDHGFLWRIRSEALDRMYLSTESMDV